MTARTRRMLVLAALMAGLLVATVATLAEVIR